MKGFFPWMMSRGLYWWSDAIEICTFSFLYFLISRKLRAANEFAHRDAQEFCLVEMKLTSALWKISALHFPTNSFQHQLPIHLSVLWTFPQISYNVLLLLVLMNDFSKIFDMGLFYTCMRCMILLLWKHLVPLLSKLNVLEPVYTYIAIYVLLFSANAFQVCHDVSCWAL